ncbi:bromodomain and WD repeat-containing 1-like [Chaetoceros tenuissimus]|uniref:Bromodomain and WD repeat-containing 1-like n=1 Tax=Chaetoceros tenuissimus TaxID=426638 RepID=A0AAD3HAA6_9STRA|nr:bromodomain and WD repeat-containing 1-like [Chaetoceros tenuissimus]
MGKKSKRHVGKRSQQKKAGVKEEAASISSPEHAPSMSYLVEQLIDQQAQEATDALEEFTMWSLSDKADLTPKKFEKMAPRTAKMLNTGERSIQQVLKSRKKVIDILDRRTKEFELQKGVTLSMREVKLKSKKEEDEFRQDLKAMMERQKSYMVPPTNVYDSFQKVAYVWKESRNACFDDCRFLIMPVSEFYHFFYEMIPAFVFCQEVTETELFQKFFYHPSARSQELKDELQKLLSSLLSLYQDMKRCWECNGICGEEIERSLICSRCKCATYCSRECQVKHWKQGTHKDCCKDIGEEWSTYERNKKRVERALYKDQRVYTKLIIVNEIEKECFLRPCESHDYYLCTCNSGDTLSSMDTFYKNIATLACGGKHLLFGDDTISSRLEEKIEIDFKDVISEFDPNTLYGYEITAMKNIASLLPYKEIDLDLTEEFIMRTMRSILSVDRFFTLYVCFESYNLSKYITGQEDFDKFKLERDCLQFWKSSPFSATK